MRRILVIIIISMTCGNVSNDSLAVLIKDGNMEILDVVKYKDPLVGKIGGLEINPLYSMLYSTGDRFCFSGTVSFFPKDQNVEIAFPFSKKTMTDNFFQISDGEVTNLNIDAQYRYFLGEFRKGVYIMGGFRYSSHDEQDSVISHSYDRSGISFGVGYRIFGMKGLYWGCSIYVGKYYWGDVNLPGTGNGFMNLEFLKFGKTF